MCWNSAMKWYLLFIVFAAHPTPSFHPHWKWRLVQWIPHSCVLGERRNTVDGPEYLPGHCFRIPRGTAYVSGFFSQDQKKKVLLSCIGVVMLFSQKTTNHAGKFNIYKKKKPRYFCVDLFRYRPSQNRFVSSTRFWFLLFTLPELRMFSRFMFCSRLWREENRKRKGPDSAGLGKIVDVNSVTQTGRKRRMVRSGKVFCYLLNWKHAKTLFTAWRTDWHLA